MTELTLLLLIFCCFVTCVAVAYWFDKRIVKNIKELEEYQIKKEKISEIRKEYKAKIADKDVMLQDKLRKLHDRTPPEEIQFAVEELQNKFMEEKKALEEEMEKNIDFARN